MANSFTADFPTIWAREQQEIFYKKNVAQEVADTSFSSQMAFGDTFKRIYRSTNVNNAPAIYTRWTDVTLTDKTDTAESMSINKQYYEAFYIDNYDAIQTNYNLALLYGKDTWESLKAQIDADVLYEVINATSTVDDGTLWGTAGNGIALTVDNVFKTVTAATKKLNKLNINDMDRVWVVSPEFEEIISQYYGAKVTDLWDSVSENGYFTKIGWFKLFVSNSLTGKAVLALATQPTDNDTVTIQSVTFTFKTTLWVTAGNVLIGASADAARGNLAALINAPSTTTAQGVALSTTNAQNFLARAVAVNDDTANTLTVRYKGAGVLAVSETLTAVADIWTTTLQKQIQLFWVAKSCTTLIMQKTPKVNDKDNPLRDWRNILNTVLYGVKTFADQAKKMVAVEIKSSWF